MYEAWHVRLYSRPPGMDTSINYHSVMVFTTALQQPLHPVVRVKISGWRWECPTCKHENEDDTSTTATKLLICGECGAKNEGVLVDADDDILMEGNPFPED